MGLVVVCPITSQRKGFAFEVAIPTGLAVAGVVLSDHVKSLDYRQRNIAFLCRLPDSVVAEVLAKLNTLVGVMT